MPTTLAVELKLLGQRKTLLPEWSIPVDDDPDRAPLRLRDLIARIVRQEVDAFQGRQQARRLLPVLTAAEIAQGQERGQILPGGREHPQTVDPDRAVETALLAFRDGLYLVFVDGAQQAELEAEVSLRADSRLTFLRLTPLAGG